ncbi:hypothetical protein IT575_01150 [bacterium]|nr:hypothetical protein [bacterium]
MSYEQLLSLIADSGGYALLLAAAALWLARVAWPTLLRKHDEALSRLERSFEALVQRIAALERREAQRIKLEWTRLYHSSGRPLEEAEREAARIMGNGGSAGL